MLFKRLKKNLFSSKLEYEKILKLEKGYNKEDVKNAYIKLSKIYHPDIYKDETKFLKIKEAYENLKNIKTENNLKKMKLNNNDNNNFSKTNENINEIKNFKENLSNIDIIILKQYKLIFGKNYEDDPLYYFSKTNLERRKIFIEFIYNLEKELNAKTKFNKLKSLNINKINKKETEFKFSNKLSYFLGSLCFGICTWIYYLLKNKEIEKDNKNKIFQEENKKEYFDNLSDNYYKKTLDKKNKEFKKIIEKYPEMIKITKEYDTLSFNDILIKYTINQDLKFFSINPEILNDNNTLEKLKNMDFGEYFEIDNKLNYNLNTYMSLSLEAERILKKIKISTKKLKKILNEKGNYEPPIIVFKFRGLNFFKLRDNLPFNKDLDLNKEYVSLFEIYFKYSSSLFYKYPLIRDFFINKNVDMENIEKWNGMVHLNKNKIYSKNILGNEECFVFKYDEEDFKHSYLLDKLFYRSYLDKI